MKSKQKQVAGWTHEIPLEEAAVTANTTQHTKAVDEFSDMADDPTFQLMNQMIGMMDQTLRTYASIRRFEKKIHCQEIQIAKSQLQLQQAEQRAAVAEAEVHAWRLDEKRRNMKTAQLERHRQWIN